MLPEREMVSRKGGRENMTMLTTIRAHSRGVRAAGRAPLMEGLEVRRLMAADPPVPMIDADGVLQVAGTMKNDVIVLSMDNSTQAPRLVVDLNGVLHSFALADLTGGVVVKGRGGSDDIRLDESGGLLGAAVTMYGGSGKDSLEGASGADHLYGCNGEDDLEGGAGADYLYGGNGKDHLEGGNGADFLYGGNGKDSLEGNDGADLLAGGWAVDTATGGQDADHFECKASEIVDMAANDGDTVEALPAA
jgi:Ca2+-binding RTX toxin-like protein